MSTLKFTAIFLMCIIISGNAISQTSEFTIDDYLEFLQQHQNMTTSQLLENHDAGLFKDNAYVSWESALYHDSIEVKYELTEYEKSLLCKHGFMVTERLKGGTFGSQFMDIFHKDLPVFISTDAIVHAFHYSYDGMLKSVELEILIKQLKKLLDQTADSMPNLTAQYSNNYEMTQMLKDVDVYLTVPAKILDPNATPFYPENAAYVNEVLNYIKSEQYQRIPFFSNVPREIDFSQFKPRGHYDDENYPELAGYFQAMIWLGRMEIYLLPPQHVLDPPSPADIQRQTINAVLISELAELAGIQSIYNEIEDIISFFVGEQDNVILPNLNYLKAKINLSNASQLLDTLVLNTFQDSLKIQPYAHQKIVSQILRHDLMSLESVVPAASFLLFGQRFVIDSYVTGNVVYDKIKFNNSLITRMLPSTLDIMFTLGNDAAAQLLVPELNKYYYASNLTSLRYLIDNYEDDFWDSSIYTMWLNSIRSLNPPSNRDNLPLFMRTAAWWQEKLNTQLSSWTELRHDNLLYAKQAYTPVPICSFPYSYVEPVPEFYQNMNNLAESAKEKFQHFNFSSYWRKNKIIDYFQVLAQVTDTLGIIAQKELNGVAFSQEEINFLKNMLIPGGICGEPWTGWYIQLFYNFEVNGLITEEAFVNETDYLIADYHTSPGDEWGNIVGWVAHAGTGPIDMAVVVATLPDSKRIAFVGPVMSYHEFTTTNFLRLTDAEWAQSYLNPTLRPDWVNLYLADETGESRGGGASLLTNVEKNRHEKKYIPKTNIIAQNYPNPFNNSTIISFSVPYDLSNSVTQLSIYNIQGRLIKTVVRKKLPAGNYLSKWDGTDESGEQVSSGIYFYIVKAGSEKTVGKMSLVK